MDEYEFRFVIDGVNWDDDEVIRVVHEEFDGLLSRHWGRIFLVVAEQGAHALDAAHRLVVRLNSELPRMRLIRLDPDLVGVTDIAERVGCTRQSVRQWVTGERRGGGLPFPDPEGTAGRSPVWRWGDVNAWLRAFGDGDDVHAPTREEALTIDFMMPKWQRALSDGLPLVQFVLATGDGRDQEREHVQRLLEGTLAVPGVLQQIAAFPRSEQQRLTVVCAVLSDHLKDVAARIGPGEAWGVLAFQGEEGGLHLQPIGSMISSGAIPLSSLGLGPDATVGDLLLVRTNGAGELPGAQLAPVGLG